MPKLSILIFCMILLVSFVSADDITYGNLWVEQNATADWHRGNVSADTICLGSTCITNFTAINVTYTSGDKYIIITGTVISWNESEGNNTYIVQAEEAQLNVNSSDFWDGLNTSDEITGLGDFNIDSLSWIRLSSYPINCSSADYVSGVGDTLTCTTPLEDSAYLSYSGYTLSFNETLLNSTIASFNNTWNYTVDTTIGNCSVTDGCSNVTYDANDINASRIDNDTWIEDSQESDLSVNYSQYTNESNLNINTTTLSKTGGLLDVVISFFTNLFYQKNEVYNKTEIDNKDFVNESLANDSYIRRDGTNNFTENFDTGAKNFSVDIDTLFVDSTNNLVGIGITSPNHTLEVLGNVSLMSSSTNQLLFPRANVAASPTICFGVTGECDDGLYSNAASNIKVAINGIVRWQFTSISMGSESSGALKRTTPTSTNPTLIPLTTDTDTGMGRNSANDGALIAGGVNVLNWNNDSYVGIGTIAPTHKLDVNGSASLNMTATNRLFLPLNNNATNPTLAFGDGDTGLYSPQDDLLIVSVGGVGIGRFFTEYFDLNYAAGPAMLREVASGTNPVFATVNDKNTGMGFASADTLSLIAGGVNALNINETGGVANVGIGTTSPNNFLEIVESEVTPTRTAVYDLAQLGIKNNGVARMYIVGNSQSEFLLDNIGNAANEQLFQFINTGGLVAFKSITDGGAERFRFFTLDMGTGDVGIGTTNPGYKLEVNGTLYTENNVTTNEYYFGQPITGGISEGLIDATNLTEDYNLEVVHNLTDSPGNITYTAGTYRIVTSTGVEKYCLVSEATVNPTDNRTTIYYIDDNCAVQDTTWNDYRTTSKLFNPWFLALMKHTGMIDFHYTTTIMNELKNKDDNIYFTFESRTIEQGFDLITNSDHSNITIGTGSYQFVRDIISTTKQNTSNNDSVEIIVYASGSPVYYEEFGLDLDNCDNGTDREPCSTTALYRRTWIGSVGGTINSHDMTQPHQVLPQQSETFSNVATCLDLSTTPLSDSFTLPSIYNGVFVSLYMYCYKPSETAWDGSFIDLRSAVGGGGGSIDTSQFATIGDCAAGEVVQNVTGGGPECTPAGAGDIISVQSGDKWIYNGSDTGAVVLRFNETELNATIDARGGADGNNYTENITFINGTTAILNLTRNDGTILQASFTNPNTGNCSGDGTCSLVLYDTNFTQLHQFGDCAAGLVVQNTTATGVECTSVGAGDITSVQGGDKWIYNGSASGVVSLLFNESEMNDTIDARAGADGNNYTSSILFINSTDTLNLTRIDNTTLLASFEDNDTTYTGMAPIYLSGTSFALNFSGGDNYFYNCSGALCLNESTLNATIDARENDTTYTADETYITMVGTVITQNGTVLNSTIASFNSSWNYTIDTTVGNCSGTGSCSNVLYIDTDSLSNFTDDIGATWNNYTTSISFNETGSTIQLNLKRTGLSNLTATFTDNDTTYTAFLPLYLTGTTFGVYLKGIYIYNASDGNVTFNESKLNTTIASFNSTWNYTTDTTIGNCSGTGDCSNIAYVTQTNAFGDFNQSFNTSTLFIDSTNARIGIGTSSPQDKLVVVGNVNITANISQVTCINIDNGAKIGNCG